MVSLRVLNSYEKPDLCGRCDGACCKSMPGASIPSDFGNDEPEIRDKLLELLHGGEWAIDWWEGDARDEKYDLDKTYFIRPATVGTARLMDPSWGGRCVFLGEQGCRIFDNRPSGCRGLEPGESGSCEVRYSGKQDCAIGWIPFQKTIIDLIDILS